MLAPLPGPDDAGPIPTRAPLTPPGRPAAHRADRRLQYIMSVLMGGTGADDIAWPDWLHYGDDGGTAPGITFIPSGFFDGAYGSEASLPRLPLAKLDGMPILFGEASVERRGERLVVHADLAASAYFLVTRYEEWVRSAVRDEHGRFPGRESLACRGGFIERPVVDEYSRALRTWAGERGLELPALRRTFSVLLTHDIDQLGPEPGPRVSARKAGALLLGRRSWSHGIPELRVALGLERHDHNNLDEMTAIDRRAIERLGAGRCRVVYFFMAEGTSEYDATYRISRGLGRRAIRHVLESGAELGLHAGYAAGLDPRLLASERRRLERAAGRPVTMNRHHYLAWREPGDGHGIAAAGIRWDSTLGYPDVAGFRLGVCRPVRLLDPATGAPCGIEEHPLTVMECSLSFEKYMALDEEAAFACVRRLADAVRAHDGELVLDWHNTSFSGANPGYDGRLLLRIVDYLETLMR